MFLFFPSSLIYRLSYNDLYNQYFEWKGFVIIFKNVELKHFLETKFF